METDDNEADPERRRFGWKTSALLCVLVLLIGAGATVLIFSTEPEATSGGATRETAMLVDVVPVRRETHRPEIVAMGTVIPARDIVLSPRIEGEIVERREPFTPGGFVEEGELLLRIEPEDYENTLRQRQSELRRAVASLEMEMGRQNVAKQGYDLLDETLSSENEALVLRKPQLNTARADVEAARAAVDQAQLDVERTRIRAPFDAHILSRNVNLGSQVSPQTDLGRLVGVDTYWVEATVPLDRLRRLSFAEDGENPGSVVRVRNPSAWPEGAHREGRLFRLIGALDDRTRLARVIVAVDDPLARKSPDQPALMIGSFVESHIHTDPIDDVVRLDRDYVHKDDTVWVMEEATLDIRSVDIAMSNADYAFVKGGLEDGDQVVTTNLATVVDGAKLRRRSPASEPGGDSDTAAGKTASADDDEAPPASSTP